MQRVARILPVCLLGCLSTAASLMLVYLLARGGFNIMGWYVTYVVPFGAVLVGIAASSGFGVGSWWSGQRLSGGLFALVAAMLVTGYFAAEYVELRVLYPNGVVDDAGQLMGYWRYFDYMTRAIHFGNKDDLGLAGYLFRAFEIVGFAGGGVLGTMGLLSKLPHCVPCGRYQRLKPVALLHGEATAAIDAIERVIDDGRRLHAEILVQAPPSQQKATAATDERMSLLLIHCPSCGNGELRVDLVAGPPEQRIGLRTRSFPLAKHVVSDVLRALR